MRNILISGMAAVAAVAIATPASALTVTYSPGFLFPVMVTPVVFQPFTSPAVADNTTYTPQSGTVAPVSFTESTTGNVRIFTGSVPGQSLDPDPGTGGQYLSVLSGSYTVSFATPLQFFSFIFGSLDNYNTLTLNFTSGAPLVLTGAQILTGIASGTTGPFNSGVNGRVSYDFQGGAGLTSAVFSSAQQAFEIDGLAGAVPEPGTWGMMILGFGAAGYALRVRRRKVAFATA